ncbi:LPXTG cell wall anchor domain-containing protein [Streptacidiphilus sp. ASG 303]|uniref:LPXTG cell wall anchor domain-containing protein n=1 Tax=Streptomycetaceae TaxID=2062 RepID=UPI001E3B2704|nr:LPXTG cell wall anchor domain-containing protein [Streptacidiphilus sp. ASG 303]MCD0483918.1 LPXTG cell wall anchor domain-containing protein [Streptacidiphilus sp. ASG 303]
MSFSRRTRAARFLGAAALTTTAVMGGAGAAHAESAGAAASPGPRVAPASAPVAPLLADTGSEDTGLLVVYAGLLVAAGGGALWALRRREEPAVH